MTLLKKMAIVAVMSAFTVTSCSTPQFYRIDSDNKVGTMRTPYAYIVNYYGYVSPEVKPQGKYKKKDAYYLYLWIPVALDEIGVAMYSPCDIKPSKGDLVNSAFDVNFNKDPKVFFDTYLSLDRMIILDPAKIKAGSNATIMPLDVNDDTSEIPANPSGSSNNSLIRIKNDVNNPAKGLVKSVYRITFTSFRGEVKGSYLCQVGTNVPGVKIADSLEELGKIVNAK